MSISRREFLKTTGALTAMTALGEIPAGALAALDERKLVKYPEKTDLILLTSRPPQLETPLPYFKDLLTPNEALFVRWHAPAPSGMVHSIELPHIQVQLKEGEGRIKAETHCAVCHSTDYITMQPKFTRAQWTATVNKMIKTYGAAISEEDANMISGYLAAQYGKEK